MKMKKLLAGVLCFGLATFALTGCGGDKQDADQPQDEQQQVEQQQHHHRNNVVVEQRLLGGLDLSHTSASLQTYYPKYYSRAAL